MSGRALTQDPFSEQSLRLDEPEPEEPGMLMTSMIDVIFILLAFFVCVSEVKKGKLHVDVPEVPSLSAAEPETPKKPLVVEVTGDDRVFVDGQAVQGDDGLRQALASSAERLGADVPVHLSGDKDAKNGTMMRVVSLLSYTGFKRIEFAVEAGG